MVVEKRILLMQKKAVKYIIIAISILLGVTVVVIALLFSIVFFNRVGIVKDRETISRQYKIVTHNPSNNATTRGIASLWRELDEDEYVSYEDEFGTQVLISNFGAREYLCTSSCLCVNNNNKRRDVTALLLVTGILALISTYGMYSAKKKAAKEVKEQCVVDYQNKCDPENIVPEVECKSLEEFEPEEERNKCDMVCKGTCKPKPDSKNKKGSQDCEKKELELNKADNFLILEQGRFKYRMSEEFRRDYLEPFCDPRGETECWPGLEGDDNIFCDPLRPVIPEDFEEELYDRDYPVPQDRYPEYP